MKNIHILKTLSLCIISLLISCKEVTHYQDSTKEDWHIIDLGAFSVETPKSFKYYQQKGIDSFVGNVKNEKIKFSFDFGMYSPKGPKDKNEYLNKYKNRLSPNSRILFFNLIDLKPYQDGKGSYNPAIILNQIKNIELKKYNAKNELSVSISDSIEYYHDFIYQDKNYKIPFYFDNRIREDLNSYLITKDTIEEVAIKLFTSKDLNKNTTAGIYQVDLNSHSESLNTYTRQLFFSSNDFNNENQKDILEILKSIRIKS